VKQQLLARLAPHGQEQLLRFWDQLDKHQQTALAEQIAAVDFDLIARLCQGTSSEEDWGELSRRAEPPPAFRLAAGANRFSPAEARERGEQALRQGKVGAILVAGGQGTRLGFDHPKGMYPIGPVSDATLFQILFEKLVAVARRYGAKAPMYVMTSPATHQETIDYLTAHARFGLAADDLQVFCQGTMPAVDAASGKVLLSAPGELFRSPDGHGGMLSALAASGALAEIARRGIEHMFYFQIDNPLVAVCDAEFLGYHLLAGSELSTQVVAKQFPAEKVGNVVSIDGKLRIIEYSDLPHEAGERRAADGSLQLWAGNTGIHAFAVSFLQRMSRQQHGLPFHMARKAAAHLDEQGRTVEPDKPNAIKFERFIFDLLPAADRAIVVEVDAARVFAPVKNGPGADRDSPQTVQQQILALHRGWLEAAGARVQADAAVEISPLFALDQDEVKAKVTAGRQFSGRTYLRD
jgi:UDP-N-acetylglucosamine/UDP-N-acetylgalactosamine diphosphorylase